ncbi:DUF2244 domain-containing protein [Acidocella sp.]|uniref:DUF2244 domain-containing protein n=1 Tax=Acidocella sp. TaxID=50710 RepID=UPI002606C174|nr:DUF2244 domain-containing protein [Acidocella sp.]
MDAATGKHGALYFEAELHPHRSLSRRALALVLGGMVLGSLYVTAIMYFMGAWPVIGFNGADILLAALLFWLNMRAARAREIIRLYDEVLEITRIAPNGRVARVEMSPDWAKVELQERPASVPVLLLRARGAVRVTEIGRQLGEAQKRDLAAAIGRALVRRREPRFS